MWRRQQSCADGNGRKRHRHGRKRYGHRRKCYGHRRKCYGHRRRGGVQLRTGPQYPCRPKLDRL